jgi:anti-sigma regulatory factor (Ser/Thr protein kinase)
MGEELETVYSVTGRDFTNAGKASTGIKDTLKRLGVPPAIMRRVAIASYEAEMNIVMYAHRGRLALKVSPDRIVVEADDDGPGIEDIDLAMQEGYSTATSEMREMGFGAGMGLPNIKRSADQLEITSEVGKGTRLKISVAQST